MRKYLVLIIVCICTVVSYSQNVGIGTSNPQNKLHVGGGFRLDTLTGVNGAGLLRHDANGVVYGIKFSGNISDVLRGDGTFGSASGGGSGTNFWTANGNNIYNNNTGNVGVGTTTPQSKFHANGTSWFTGDNTPLPAAAGKGVAICQAGDNGYLFSFDYSTFTPKNLLLNSPGGNVGIGTASPSITLDIKTPTFGGGTRTISDGAANFIVQTTGGTNSWARYYMRSTNRSWFIGTSQNFNGDQLYIVDETANQTRLAIQSNGNVGIGTVTPATRLTLNGGTTWTSNGWTASMNMQNASALGWEANASGQRFGIGQTNGGLFFFRTNSAFGNQANPANYDLAITDAGNMTQNLGSFGLPKAMIFINGDGTILRCYNGTSGATTGGCGFTTGRLFPSGSYYLDFPFDISSRFFSVSAQQGCCGVSPVTVTFEPFNNTRLRLYVWLTEAESLTDRPVMVIVY